MTKGSIERPRILHVFGQMNRGGAEMRTIELFEHLHPDGYRFDFATLSVEPGDLDSRIEELGGCVYRFAPNLTLLPKLWCLLKEQNYSIVHSHLHYFTGIILLVAWLARVPVRIAHFRSTGDGHIENLTRRFRTWILIHLIDRLATDIIGVSQAALDWAAGTLWGNDARYQVIYSGISHKPLDFPIDEQTLQKELGLRPGAKIVIHVGRFAPEKNHRLLLEIMHHLLKINPLVELILVGRRDTSIEAELEQQAARLGIRDQIHMLGVRTDTARLLAGSHLMIFPSLREGLPGAVLEAIAAGTPVLASRIPGIEELEPLLERLALENLEQSAEVWSQRASFLLSHHSRVPGNPARLPDCLTTESSADQFRTIYGGLPERRSERRNQGGMNV